MQLFIKSKLIDYSRETDLAIFLKLPNMKYGFYFPKRFVRQYKINFSWKIAVLFVPNEKWQFQVYKLKNNEKEIWSYEKIKFELENKDYYDSLNEDDILNVPKFLDNIIIDKNRLSDLND